MRRTSAILFAGALALALPSIASGQDLVVDGTSMMLGGTHTYDHIRVINNGTVSVTPYNGVDRVNTGNLVLIARVSIFVDATSRITARGAGYSTVRCGNGVGPATAPASGGRGGCALSDSGGGGAHFGRGGRGTTDCFLCGTATGCEFPSEYEQDCGNSLNAGGTACTSLVDCRGACAVRMGIPTTAGQPYFHNIYDIEFGGSGGDKGCRDGDGFGAQPDVAGPGGGRIVLVSLTAAGDGSVDIAGTVSVNGKRGCGTGNDSAGGGAGGSLLVVTDDVTIEATAHLTAAGGRGGDTFAAAVGSPDFTDCPPGAQTGGTCDDCGGGGGGGIITVLSVARTISESATFDVGGALGGVCPICTGEAGGGAGELQLDGLYVGEVCDGYDNDFDGMIDEDFTGTTTVCGLGACATSIPSCTAGSPPMCVPTVTPGDATCESTCGDSRPRVAVILDTSASMLESLAGYPTFGDGSVDHPGIDVDGDGMPNDSRLFLAKTSLDEVISSYPEVDFALARYHADTEASISCQTATWLECAGIFASYDNPTDNTGPISCNVATGPASSVVVHRDSHGDECINYAGFCGPPRRGADVLSGFGTDTRDLVRWLDGRELRFDPSTTPGNFCNHGAGGDCELRATGETPLAGSLQAVEDYVTPIKAEDCAAACRGYTVVLVTDGAESCAGNPVAVAQRLHDIDGVEVYVVAVSVLPSEVASLNAIAMAGSGGTRTATLVTMPAQLVPALTAIVAGSIRTERCNGVDDNCNGLIDEGFPGLGAVCDDGGTGVCRGTGTNVCSADHLSVTCSITMPGATPMAEVCNGMDDNCNGRIDEGLTCTGMCTPMGAEVCDGVDNDCNGAIDEADPALGTPCGSSVGICMPGTMICIRGMLVCSGGVGPRPEVCNGLDDDCDGVGDNLAPCPGADACITGTCVRPCSPGEFACPPGYSCEAHPEAGGSFCIAGACASCTADQRCDVDHCVDLCAGVTCPTGESCHRGLCLDCYESPCPSGQVCRASTCVADPCTGITCTGTTTCSAGSCISPCDDRDCPHGQACDGTGRCVPSHCTSVSCPTGQTCDPTSGACVVDRCTTCPTGRICVPATGCADDPCTVTHCDATRVCRVNAGGFAECVRPGMDLDGGGQDASWIRAEGGGGLCSVNAQRGPLSGPLILLLALTLIVRRRSRRALSQSDPSQSDPSQSDLRGDPR